MPTHGKIVLKTGRKIDRTEMAAHESDIKWVCNQGVRTSRIIRRLKELEFDNPEFLSLRNELLEFWGVDDLIA